MQLSESEIREFKQEATELIDEAETALLSLNEGGVLSNVFDQIFRCLHSVKGAASAIGLGNLQGHMHELETFFSGLPKQGSLTPEQMDKLLAGCDRARTLLASDEAPADTPKPAPVAESMAPAPNDTAAFVQETRDILRRLNANLASIEKSGTTPELIGEFYRDIHTIKGTAMLFAFSEVGTISHALETYLESYRENPRDLSAGEVDRLYAGFDAIDKMLEFQPGLIPVPLAIEVNHITASFLENPPPQTVAAPAPSATAPTANAPTVKLASTPPAPVAAAAKPAPFAAPPVGAPADGASEASTSIRISISILDQLMTLVGEMVLVRNQVTQYANSHDDLHFMNLSQRLDAVTAEMQAEVMKTRMQPVSTILTKFQRVVRDLARDLGKQIDISFVGTETELDRALLEAIKDPLMHIVRNSCDHGLESPADRAAQGKSEVGRVVVRSIQEGGHVIIEVTDDGKGLNKEALIKKALEQGLVTQDHVAALTDAEIYNFIFAPGLSTAKAVTNISGRGVGMDVVKKNIERIGGVVDISSETGRGTSIRIKIPLTLAIIPAMIVRSGQARYAIPQVKLVELVRVEPDRSSPRIELLQGRPVVRLRGNLLPIVFLDEALDPKKRQDPCVIPTGVTNIVVVQAESGMYGLGVDEVLDTADIVVKPLGKLLKSLATYSGATVLGDGSISLIVDVNGIADRQNLRVTAAQDVTQSAPVEKTMRAEANEFLLVDLRGAGKHAIPLSIIHRMEEFNADRIERSGAINVVRYGNLTLPILDLHTEMKYPEHPRDPHQKISVIVSQLRGRLIGLEVQYINDIIRSESTIDDSFRDRDSILGTLSENNEVLTVIDVHQVLESSSIGKTQGKPKPAATAHTTKILLAEDTEFFRRQISKVLRNAGHDVVTAEHGRQALSMLKASDEAAREFSLILSDIEMPHMNGFELARAVRADTKLRSIPLVAITTRFTDAAIAEGKRSGFDEYLEKLNPDGLLQSIDRVLGKSSLEAHG